MLRDLNKKDSNHLNVLSLKHIVVITYKS